MRPKSGLTEIEGSRARGTNRGERDRHDPRVLPWIQARRSHTDDLPPLIVPFKAEDLSQKGVIMCPPPITHC